MISIIKDSPKTQAYISNDYDDALVKVMTIQMLFAEFIDLLFKFCGNFE